MFKLISYTDRKELKFLIDYSTYSALMKFIGPLIVRDRFSGKSGKYIVHSVYFDTPSNNFFWEKVEGEKVRKKVRIRTYIDYASGKEMRTIIEIKKKDRNKVYKEKMKMGFEEAFRFIENPNISDVLALASKGSR